MVLLCFGRNVTIRLEPSHHTFFFFFSCLKYPLLVYQLRRSAVSNSSLALSKTRANRAS